METFRDLDNFNERIMTETVYHSGDFAKKADVLGQMAGRSTGYFGTGYYFCTNPEKVENLGDDRPIFSFAIKDCNMAIGTLRLHDYLKVIQKYVVTKGQQKMLPDLEDLWKLNYHFEKFCGEWDSKKNKLGMYLKGMYEEGGYDWNKGEYEYENWLQCRKEYEDDYSFQHLLELIDTLPQLKEISEELKKEEPDWEHLNELDNGLYFNPKEYKYYRDLFSSIKYVPFGFHHSAEEIIKAADEVAEDLSKYYDYDGILISWADAICYTDSIPTRVMKKLGYDGVYPSPECDNTTYGGVVYDKENIEDLKQIR